jgi:pantoate--beta-alanine ligase
MDVIHTVADLRARLSKAGRVGFVPTMGNLHSGHIDLTRIAQERSDCTVVSVFVNRLQFGPSEDFDRYPRTLKEDSEKCQAAGVDVVFAPDEAEMYPSPQQFTVDPGPIQAVLEGAVRPGHFRGVATVVLKLFGMVSPDVAVFGKKDYQQCQVIKALVQQFALPIELALAETSRAPDGLALSSRNAYLSTKERTEAPALHATLNLIVEAIRGGDREYSRHERRAAEHLEGRGWQPDYVTVRRQTDLAIPAPGDRALVVLAAARLGTTRLLDNREIVL